MTDHTPAPLLRALGIEYDGSLVLCPEDGPPNQVHGLVGMDGADLATRRAQTAEIARRYNHHAELVAALWNIVLNADIAPDPRMKGSTDCYVVTLDDIDAARALLARLDAEATP